jgi:hypothetical protein
VLGNSLTGVIYAAFFEADQCAIWNPGYRRADDIFAMLQPVGANVRRTLVDAPYLYSRVDKSWTGSRNVYRTLAFGQPEILRTTFKSPEDGSRAGEPLLWQAQQWRLLPGQLNGKTYGADVDRVRSR